MRKRLYCDARIDLSIEVRGPMLIKSGEFNLAGADMVPMLTRDPRSGKLVPVIPGTSLKGVMRSHVERLFRSIADSDRVVCEPFGSRSCWEQKTIGDLPLRKVKNPDTAQVYRLLCPACKMFGSLAFKGRVFPADALPRDPKEVIVERRDGVGIDRKTGGAANQVKYDYDVVVSGTFQTSILLDNFEFWQLGAAAAFLQALGEERIRLGMGTSRGLGHVRGRVERLAIRYFGRAGRSSQLRGLAELVSQQDRERYEMRLPKRPTGIDLARLTEKRASGLWTEYELQPGEEEVWWNSDAPLGKVFQAAQQEFVAYAESLARG